MATEHQSGSGQLSAAFHYLALGGLLLVVSCVATFSLLCLNQRTGGDSGTARPETAQDSSSRDAGEDASPGLQSIAWDQNGQTQTDFGAAQVGRGERRAHSGFAPSPQDLRMRDATGFQPGSRFQNGIQPAGSTSSGPVQSHHSADLRLERIEHQLNLVLRSVGPGMTAGASDLPREPESSRTIVSPVSGVNPASLGTALSESIRAAANESQIRRELSDLRATSEVTLQGLQQQLKGISQEQKRLKKSLRGETAPESGSVRVVPKQPLADLRPGSGSEGSGTAAAHVAVTAPIDLLDIASESRLAAATPTFSQQTVAGPDPAITVVSTQPMRITVRTRSTTIAEFLAEFAETTGSDLLIATELNPKIQAISLSDIAPDELFRLLSEKQPFEIQYETNRVALRSRPTQSALRFDAASRPVEMPVPRLSPASELPATRTSILATNEGKGRQMDLPSDFKPASQAEAVLDLPSLPPTELQPAVPETVEPSPVEKARPIEQAAPATVPTVTYQRRQRYELFATVMHVTLTNTQAVEPEGVIPIPIHENQRPGHPSAVRQVLEQAAGLGRVTPVTEASVELVEGQSARLKIGSQCLHCNTEYGVDAGDTLRVLIDRSTTGEPRLMVQGLTAGSDEALSTLGSFESALPASRSLLVCESGTAGYVAIQDKSSRLARLPVIGNRFQKSKQIRQIAQRFIVLTLRPVGFAEVALAPTAGRVETVARSEAKYSSGPQPRAVSKTDSAAFRPVRFQMPDLPAPAMSDFESARPAVEPVIPQTRDEMPIHESEATELLPAPPAEEGSFAVAGHTNREDRTSSAPRLIEAGAVEAARAIVSPPRAATPTTKIIAVPQVPAFQQNTGESESGELDVQPAGHTGQNQNQCLPCRKVVRSLPRRQNLISAAQQSNAKIIERLPAGHLAERSGLETSGSSTTEKLDAPSFDLPVPDDL